MPSIDQRLAEIDRRLQWLREQDRAATVFGAQSHQYQPKDPLDEAAIAQFEQTHDVPLPATYRAYLQRIGNGGAGPFYGLHALEPMEIAELPQNYVEVTDEDGEVLAAAGTGPRPLPDVVSSLARPFPLSGPWSPQERALPVEPGTSPYDGCIRLADQGCGYFDFLVVRGPFAGQVWSDYTAGDGPIGKSHDDFLDWYEEWLDRAQLEWVEGNAADMAQYAPRHYPGLEECVALLDRALARSPEWAAGWRARGYVALNREQWDEADAAFVKASELDDEEPAARLCLDRARMARAREQWSEMLDLIEVGLSQEDQWASTTTSLLELRLQALDELGEPERAMEALEALAEDECWSLRWHFALAGRRLARGEDEAVWALLDEAAEEGTGRDDDDGSWGPATVYERFAQWLVEAGAPEDAVARVRQRH